jgi:polar amino acid transport system substrate-binding protein
VEALTIPERSTMRPSVRAAFAALMIAVLAFTAGCAAEKPAEPFVEPKVSPPAITEVGVLAVGVDLELPPFAGVDKGREAGLDIDVAAALATELGLDLRLVQVAPSEATTALADGTVDIVMSMPLSEETVLGASLAGTYITDGPAFFASAEETATLTLEGIGGRSVAAQEGSMAYWLLEYALGEDAIQTFPTLREAFEAAEAGDVDVVAGDALIGAYIARDFEDVRFAGQIGPAAPLGIAVAQENPDLGDAVRGALDALAADGVLDAIRTNWVGDLPPLEVTGLSSTDATETP